MGKSQPNVWRAVFLIWLVFIFSNLVWLIVADGPARLAFVLIGLGLLTTIIAAGILVRENFVRFNRRRHIALIAERLSGPLIAVKWNLKTLLDGEWGELNGQQNKFLRRSYEANEQMIRLIDFLVDIAGWESGQYQPKLVKADLLEILDSTIKDLKTKAEQSHVKINFKKPLTPVNLAVDREKICQAFLQIIDNALRYNLAGGKVEVALSRKGNYWQIDVADTGIGVPPAQLSNLFTKFFRAANIHRLQLPGFGLGLRLAHLIVKAHGGKILVMSAENKGTTFSVILPL